MIIALMFKTLKAVLKKYSEVNFIGKMLTNIDISHVLISVTPATQEAEIRRIMFQS
jgi:hypothetical protein